MTYEQCKTINCEILKDTLRIISENYRFVWFNQSTLKQGGKLNERQTTRH